MIIYNRFTEKNKVPQPLQFSELTLKIKRHDIALFLVFAKLHENRGISKRVKIKIKVTRL